MIRTAVAVTLLLSIPAFAETLDIQQELSQPGVKLLVVEFYATWCKHCMAAVPKWKELSDTYRKHGLRFIAVSVEGGDLCAKPPDWSPDKTLCDEDDGLQKQMGVKNLPQSFLYSWQGNLSLSSHEVDPIKEAIESYFKDTQLTMVVDEVNVIGDKCAVSGNPEWLRGFIAGKIKEQSKFDVVSVSSESVPLTNSSTCSLDFPPNSVMRVALQGDCRGHRTMTLTVEKDGCTLASDTEPYKGRELDEDPGSMREAASAAIQKMMGQFISSRVRKPVHAGKANDAIPGYEELKKACDGGEMMDCYNLGGLYSSGLGVEKDEKKATDYFQKACYGGAMQGCMNLAKRYYLGLGVDRDEQKSVELLRKCCDKGEMRGCYNLGKMYGSGKGVDKDEKKAAGLYKKSCEGGDMKGCDALGWAYYHGRGIKKNKEKAIDFYRKSCNGGDSKGCSSLKKVGF